VSGSARRAGDYKAPDGDIPNSFNRAGFAEVGLAYTSNDGYFGGSYAYDRSHYGIPLVEEGETNLDPRRQIFNVRGERRNIGGIFDSVRGSFGVRRYLTTSSTGTSSRHRSRTTPPKSNCSRITKRSDA
jgi:hypothetical protein